MKKHEVRQWTVKLTCTNRWPIFARKFSFLLFLHIILTYPLLSTYVTSMSTPQEKSHIVSQDIILSASDTDKMCMMSLNGMHINQKDVWLYTLTTWCIFLEICVNSMYRCKEFSSESFFPCCQRQLWWGGLYTSNLYIWTQAGATCCLQELESPQCSWQASTVSGTPPSSAQEQPPSKAQAVCRGGRHSSLCPQPCQLNTEHRRSLRWYR